MKWTDTCMIGRELAEKYPDIDPIAVRLDDVKHWLGEIPCFADMKQTDIALHAVHKAWISESVAWHIEG